MKDNTMPQLEKSSALLNLQQQIDELKLNYIALQEDIEYLSLSLSKLENTNAPNPYGDDDFATPEDIDYGR